MRSSVVVALLLATSCNPSVTFSVTESADTSVERCPLGVSVLAALGFGGFADIQLADTQEFKNQGVTSDDVKSVKLTALDLRVLDPAGTDLRYLDRVAFYAEAPGQPRVLVAERVGFPSGQGSVEFDVKDVELQPYVVADSMKLTTDVTANGCPSDDQNLRATATFEVEATSQGVARYVNQ